MIRKANLHVKVQPGTFPSERTISFEVDGKRYTLFVDERDVHGSTIEVAIVGIDQNSNRALIDLPTDTFSSGSRIFVPLNILDIQDAAGWWVPCSQLWTVFGETCSNRANPG